MRGSFPVAIASAAIAWQSEPPTATGSGWLRLSVNGRGATHVKSAGWENRMAHLPSIHSWKCMSPIVVCAVKSGTMFPRRSTCKAVRRSIHTKRNIGWRASDAVAAWGS